ncbi:MAG: hypothetical protein C4527_16595 [Candidatus Omnitrophota bacterium]|jgi:hypothetical protein|nr:MAG: hypothetical protein C4527_16595 [Candidatus Omnitrophota bacterium]
MHSIVRACIVMLSFLAILPVWSLDHPVNAYAKWQNGPPSDPGYFPIAVWLQSPNNAARYKAAGINLYVGLWKGPIDEQLAALKKAGMQVICSQNKTGLAHRLDQTIVGWMHGDEPDNAQPVTDPQTGKRTYGPPIPPQKIVDDYHKLAANDPTRPILLNLGQGVANDEWKGRGIWGKPEDYLTYVKGCDIVSYDVYPVAGIRKADGENYLWYVAKGVDRLRQWSEGQKIIWNCIECTHISDVEHKATPHQVRAEVWMSIIHGSTGIIYFVHEFEPKFNEHALLDDADMLASVTTTNQQIHKFAPILNSRTLDGKVTVKTSNENVPVDVMVKQGENARYIFAVGMRNAQTDATFFLQDHAADAKVEVVDENRTLEINDGQFQDQFAPYDVHVYKIDIK